MGCQQPPERRGVATAAAAAAALLIGEKAADGHRDGGVAAAGVDRAGFAVVILVLPADTPAHHAVSAPPRVGVEGITQARPV